MDKPKIYHPMNMNLPLAQKRGHLYFSQLFPFFHLINFPLLHAFTINNFHHNTSNIPKTHRKRLKMTQNIVQLITGANRGTAPITPISLACESLLTRAGIGLGMVQ
jgi:hypothetical protein